MESARTNYDTVDEMFRHLDDRSERATQRLHDQQRTIGPGSQVVTMRGDIVRFGRILAQPEIEGIMLLAGVDPAEVAEHAAAQLADERYAFGVWYSVPMPGGEVGSTHKFNLWPISSYAFGVAEACDWQISAMPVGAYSVIAEALAGLAAHLTAVGGVR